MSIALDSPAVLLPQSPGTSRSRTLREIACLVIVIVSLLSWRNDDYYSGGLDPVVVAKGFLALISLVLAIGLFRSAPTRSWVTVRTVGFTSVYLLIALLGGLGNGSLLANVTLVARVEMVLIIMLCLAMAMPLEHLLDRVSACLGGVGVVLALSGIPQYASTGRLAGGVLPVNANQVAVLLGPLTLVSLWRMLNERARRYDPALFAALVLLAWLTGSRTALIGLVVALVTVLVCAPRLPVPAVIGTLLMIPALFYVLYLSPLVSHFFGRGGAQNLSTLSSRTIAWKAAIAAPANFWQEWFGRGLGVKEVAVSGTYWNAQVLDSSWLSAYVQVGLVGAALLGLWVLATVASSARARRPFRAILLAMTLYAVINSLLVTGLLDAYVLFVVMLLPAFGSEVATASPVSGGVRSPVSRRR